MALFELIQAGNSYAGKCLEVPRGAETGERSHPPIANGDRQFNCA